MIWSYGALPAQNSQQLSHHYDRWYGEVNFATGETVDGVIDPAIKAHAALMVLGWIIFVFLGMTIARFGKGNSNWFNFHRGFVVTGLLFVLIAWCIGIFRIGTGTQLTHFALGTTAFLMLVFQPLNALIRPHAPNQGEAPSKKRALWNLLHHWNARLAFLFAVINTYIGLGIVGVGKGIIAVYSIFLVLLIVFFFYLQWRALRAADPKRLMPPTNPDASRDGASI